MKVPTPQNAKVTDSIIRKAKISGRRTERSENRSTTVKRVSAASMPLSTAPLCSLRMGKAAALVRFFPARRLGDVSPNPQYHQGRQHADQIEVAPGVGALRPQPSPQTVRRDPQPDQ